MGSGGDETVDDYSELKHDVFWAAMTLLLFMFIFGGLEFVYRREELTQLLRANDFVKIVTDFTMIGLVSAFVAVMTIGVLIWRAESSREKKPNEQKLKP
jgi:heme/copper-type cytochrome/quinol oxidase subunit 1